ncbi:MAG: hypothetical protein BHV77_02720 [Bacteroides sp. 43_108]|nr:MAG: hypothetical protein BHV77_02720 [Bacteroides sp. 43_108]
MRRPPLSLGLLFLPIAVRRLRGLQEVGDTVCNMGHFLVPFEHGLFVPEQAYFLVVAQSVQGVGEVHHVRAAGRKLTQTVQFPVGKPLPWLVAECPCPDEVAACHAALVGGALDLRKLLFRDLGDNHLVAPYNGLLLLLFLIGGILVFPYITDVFEKS